MFLGARFLRFGISRESRCSESPKMFHLQAFTHSLAYLAYINKTRSAASLDQLHTPQQPFHGAKCRRVLASFAALRMPKYVPDAGAPHTVRKPACSKISRPTSSSAENSPPFRCVRHDLPEAITERSTSGSNPVDRGSPGLNSSGTNTKTEP